MGVLTIYLDKVENLCNRDLGTGSDPYVKFEIEQDNWVSGDNRGLLLIEKYLVFFFLTMPASFARFPSVPI